ncbi:hypothetical protein KFK09_020315 [Dendrobium nobile]|uniref:Uncharacterized protein n=1 Tax=Dendrobium nobile TaxID=94219 RepID=A0A8T3AUL3_DENNO|nr:hypothetical protein KFK09_020315 [Dendrobium nobile]
MPAASDRIGSRRFRKKSDEEDLRPERKLIWKSSRWNPSGEEFLGLAERYLPPKLTQK